MVKGTSSRDNQVCEGIIDEESVEGRSDCLEAVSSLNAHIDRLHVVFAYQRSIRGIKHQFVVKELSYVHSSFISVKDGIGVEVGEVEEIGFAVKGRSVEELSFTDVGGVPVKDSDDSLIGHHIVHI